MSDLDTNVMRATYATAATYRQSPDPERAAKFDAWLDQVRTTARREGQAEAWDRAESAAWDAHKRDHHEPWGHMPANPYRKEATR